MKKSVLLTLGIVLLMSVPAGAATITTPDGVLSIETTSDQWKQKSDSGTWLALTDGKSTLEMDHLRKGEELQSVTYPSDGEKVIYQAYITTNNEVFSLKAEAASQADLGEVIKMIGTIRVLKFNTKTAVQETAQEEPESGFGLRTINAPYTVTVDELNIRSSYDTNASVVAVLKKDDQVLVIGAVTKDGADYGWYQVQYNGDIAYASASFLSPNSSTASASGTSSDSSASAAADNGSKYATGDGFPVISMDGNYVGILVPYSDGVYYTQGEMAPYYPDGDGNYYGGIGEGRTVYQAEQCAYCGEWFPAGGGEYRNHVLLAHPDEYFGDFTSDEEGEMIMCEYCGEWFAAGNDYRNHVLAAHQNNENSEETPPDGFDEPIRCEYCHLYFPAGEIYENHLATHLDGSWEEANQFQCPYCGEWVQAGPEYRGHVYNNHPEEYPGLMDNESEE